MKDFLDGVKDRFNHPVFGIFASFFIMCNYDIFLILLSSETIYSKMYFIDTILAERSTYQNPLLLTIGWLIVSFLTYILYQLYEGGRDRFSSRLKSIGVGSDGNEMSIIGKARRYDSLKERLVVFLEQKKDMTNRIDAVLKKDLQNVGNLIDYIEVKREGLGLDKMTISQGEDSLFTVAVLSSDLKNFLTELYFEVDSYGNIYPSKNKNYSTNQTN